MNQLWKALSFILILFFSQTNVSSKNILTDEICDNGIDDDDDGLIDINDPDCFCDVVDRESLIPNSSFEDYNCCPDSDSQLNCVIGWHQASGGTTDYINTCGYMIGNDLLQPFPDGEGAVVFLAGGVDLGNGIEIYKEYAGVCLNSPMLKDSTYIFKFHIGFLDADTSPEIRFAFFGSSSCDNLPFSIETDCPTNYPEWQFRQAEVIKGTDEVASWVEVTTTVIPTQDINALVIGGDCFQTNAGELGIYFLDNLRLNNESNFDFELTDLRSLCHPNFTFSVAFNPNFLYQWYKNGIALEGETDAELAKMYGEGSYQLRIIESNSGQCRIADDFEFEIPVFTKEIHQTICEGGSFSYEGDILTEEGSYDYILISEEGCDSIVTLNINLVSNLTDTMYAKVLDGQTFSFEGLEFSNDGEHHIELITDDGCIKILVLHLDFINVFIPNIFSPNGDNRNDFFEVFTSDDEHIMEEIAIYDRWGNLLFVGNKWDGTYENKYMNSGVYVYVIKVIDREGEISVFSDSFTLLR